ncbi:hypothetical protein BX600DRAFT_82211 [Xylariales sp. PMI_506]|nr:hypothetical protein BX600DRAFT_82211 [Xylariales sp. PMI_506]
MFKKLSALRKKDGRDNGDDARRANTGLSGHSSISPGPLSSQTDSVRSSTAQSVRTATGVPAPPANLKAKATDSGPLGLNVVYTPNDNVFKADIVFVHGLGGTSRWTWSKYKNAELFWPLTFLPLEPELCHARILTFGYNAAFQKSGSVTTSVYDFAKDLLFDLKYAKDENKEELGIGNVPIIFVVHSMGGLVVKEAYMQGQNDPNYEAIIKAVSAIIFLSTPHRGTNLAQTLNRILDTILITNSKQYIADLKSNSLTLQKLNEQFRHIAPRLDIVSFYETLPTPIGLSSMNVMVLERDSSVLGYPGEISKPLNADHHGVCKYESQQDPNYITVRNVLKTLMSKLLVKDTEIKPDFSNRRASLDLRAMLGISELPGVDYIFFRDRWTEGTSEWILQEDSFMDWRRSMDNNSEQMHRVIWLSGGAGTGKSILSSFVVNTLVEEGAWCQYFYIRFGDRKKRTLSMILRSLVFQIAQVVPGFLQRVTELADEAIDFETADPKFIWDRVFKMILFRWKGLRPFFWVIDGLDEAEDPRAAIRLLIDISSSITPIRILFTGRRTTEIASAFDRIPQGIGYETINVEGHLGDLRQYIQTELSLSGSIEFQEYVKSRLIEGSQNNFLWVHLAVDKVNQAYTHADIEAALQELPMGMKAVYDRMASSIEKKTPDNKSLAAKILQCVACSVRVLRVAELAHALGDVLSEILDLPRTIMDLCGGFVVVDSGGNVAMIHQTAQAYLLDRGGDAGSLRVDRQAAHKLMFISCMRCFSAPGLKAKLERNQKPEFLEYATSSWSSHLVHANPQDQEVAAALKRFLSNRWVLTWIYILAASGQLRVLVRTSSNLSTFVAKRRHTITDSALQAEGVYHIENELFESWSVDLLRIVGKFNNLLRRRPDAIYRSIPPFCPASSSIYQFFGKTEAKTLSVTGFSTHNWDDALARISVGQGSATLASAISTAGSHIAILASSGNVFLHDSSDFVATKASPIKHGERVDRMQLNGSATLLATYGFKTTKVWEVSTGKCKLSVNSIESKSRPLALLFADNNSKLIVGTDDRRVRSLNLEEAEPSWGVIAELDEQEIDGQYTNSASHMALNSDGSLVAVGYRRHPLSAWETDGPEHIGHCRRKDETSVLRELRELLWHPHLPEILALNLEGVVVKWSPYEDEVDELAASATKLAINRDGNLFATGDGHGRVKIYTTAEFSLIYQLAAQETVFGLAFSPNSRRLYDIRGYYANAWEPNTLLRFAEQSNRDAESVSDTHTIAASSEVSVVLHGAVSSITALAGSPKGRWYCCGTERGVVSLHDIKLGRIADLFVSRAKFTIEKIAWSSDGKLVAFTDMSKQLTVMSIMPGDDPAKPTVDQKSLIPLKKATKGPILQLLFQHDSSHILVCTTSHLCTISLETTSVEHSLELSDAPSHWMEHPDDPSLIVGVNPDNVNILDWNLAERLKTQLPWQKLVDLGDGSMDTRQIDQVLVTHDKSHIILQTSFPLGHSKESQFFSMETSYITPATNQQENVATGEAHPTASLIFLNALAPDLFSDIALGLSCLSKSRLLFLSKAFAVCSAQLQLGSGPDATSPRQYQKINAVGSSAPSSRRPSAETAEGAIQELFGLPGDWVSRECITLCSVWRAEKAFLCPRNGEGVVVKCSALA